MSVPPAPLCRRCPRLAGCAGGPRPGAAPGASPAVPRVALLGMPNTGKSTLFNRLTGSAARVGNWPGVTVDLATATASIDGVLLEVVDLPGAYGLDGATADEQAVRGFLDANPVDLLVVVINARQLDRQLPLALEARALGLPLIVVLNMADEAAAAGLQVDAGHLTRELGVPVVLASARRGQGLAQVRRLVRDTVCAGAAPGRPGDARSCPAVLDARLEGLLAGAVRRDRVPDGTDATARIDRWALHPWLGLPVFFAVMYALFQGVYALGGPAQAGLAAVLERLRDSVLVPGLEAAPPLLVSFLLDGVYDGVGTVLSFLPIIFLFFVLLALVEDSGYLARAAFLVDGFMARLGLDGRAFVMQLMGFGCNVPALLGTRTMRSRSLRLLTMLMLPFSLCAARLQVFLFLSAAVFVPRHAALVVFGLYVASFAAAFLTAWIYSGRFAHQEPMLLELPPYRMPLPLQVLRRGWLEARQFVRQAGGFILGGVIVVWLLTYLPAGAAPAGPESYAGRLAEVLEPLLAPLGFDSLMGVALLFGVVAKEVVIGAMAVIYGAGEADLQGVIAARFDWIQAVSFMLFVLLYTPCLSTVAVLRREAGSWRFTLLAVAWPLALAWAVSFVFYQGMSWLVG